MIRKINFKQPKYIFPLVVFIPLCALVYFVMQTFGGSEDAQQTVATDRINTELPQANAEEAGDKMYEMSRRFGDEDAFTAVGAIGEEQKKAEELEHGYSEDELNKLDAVEAEQLHLLLPKAILHRMTSPVTWRKSSAEVTSVRRPLKADWVSDVLTEMNKQTSNVGIPLSRSTRLKRNATVPSSSSSPVIPMRRSSIQ